MRPTKPQPARTARHPPLVPKSRGGRHAESVHRVCRRQIRAFVGWVLTKPDDFFVATRKSTRLHRR